MSLFGSIGDGLNQWGPTLLPVAGAGAGFFLSGGNPMGALVGGSLGAGVGNMWGNQQNLAFQQNNLDYQKRLQKDIFAREDNSIYRRTLDLVRSGLSPVLAAGSGASAGSIVTTKALERAQTPDVAAVIMSLLKMKEDISNTISQRSLIEQQASKAQAESNLAWRNWKIYSENPSWKGIPSTTGGMVGQLAAAFGGAGKQLEQLPQEAKEVLDKVTDSLLGPQKKFLPSPTWNDNGKPIRQSWMSDEYWNAIKNLRRKK